MYKIVSKYAKSIRVGDYLVDFGDNELSFNENLNKDKSKLKTINLSLNSAPFYARIYDIQGSKYSLHWDENSYDCKVTLEQLSDDSLGWGCVVIVSEKELLFLKLKYSHIVVD